MKRTLTALLLAFFVLTMPGQAQEAKTTDDPTQKNGAKKRLLLITESRGFVHGVVHRPVTVVAKETSVDRFPKMEGLEVRLIKGEFDKALKESEEKLQKLSKELADDTLPKQKQKDLASAIKNLQIQIAKTKEKNKDRLAVTYNGRLTKPLEIKNGDELLAVVKPCLVEKTFMELADKTGFFDVDCSQNSRVEITGDNLKKYDAVFFYTTGSLPLNDAQKSDLLAFVRSGKGFGGSHCATDTFYNWPEYGQLIGAYFDGHPWTQKIRVIVEDKNHASTKHLGDAFVIDDEIYQFRTPYGRDKLHVLMRLDMDSVKNPGRRQDKDNALAWTHDFGKGHVFYTALGHREQVWEDPRFRQHIIGGLRYMFGMTEKSEKSEASGKN